MVKACLSFVHVSAGGHCELWSKKGPAKTAPGHGPEMKFTQCIRIVSGAGTHHTQPRLPLLPAPSPSHAHAHLHAGDLIMFLLLPVAGTVWLIRWDLRLSCASKKSAAPACQ